MAISNTQRYVGAGVTLAVLAALGYFFSDIITWVVLAWIVSLLGSPLMHILGKIRFGKWRIPASVRAFVVLMTMIGGLFLMVGMIVPVVIQQGRNLAGVNYAKIMEGLDEPLSHANDWLVERGIIEGELSKYALKDSLQADSLRRIEEAKNAKKEDTSALQKYLRPMEVPPLPKVHYTAADTVYVDVNLGDTSHNSTIYTNAKVPIDSLLYYDSTMQSYAVRNVEFSVRVNVLGLPTKADLDEILHDSTAIVKPTDSAIEKLKKKLFTFVNPSALIAQTASYTINFFGNFILLLTSVAFIAFFFLKDEGLFGRGIKAAIPDAYAERTDAALGQIRRLLTRYFGGVLLQIFCIALFVSTALWLLGIKNAILIGFFAAFINIIPYLGPLIGALFAILVTVSSNLDLNFYDETLPMIYKVLIVFLVVQKMDGFVLQPLIFSSSIMAHPIEVFLVVIVGAKLGGITGMIVALPIYTIFRVIASVFLSEFKIVQQLTQHLKEEPKPEPQADGADILPNDMQ